jgi:translation initiation factor 3 subunit F
LQYVEAVLSGKVKPDNSIGRKLLDLVNAVPKMTPEEFEKMINSSMKVNMMASWLTSGTL